MSGFLLDTNIPSAPCAIFLDANVLQDAVFEKPVITKQTFRLGMPWGDFTHDVAITVPSYGRREGWLQYEIDCLPRLAEQVRLGRFAPYISTELDFELAESDSGAFVTSALSFFHGISLRKVPDPFRHGRIVASSHQPGKEFSELRNHMFATNIDQRFNEIKQAAGGNKNADAFHILSAERAGVDYFVTVDKKLINSLRNQRHVRLSVKVVFPSELLDETCGEPLPQVATPQPRA
jgi:hypothetical protein